MKIVERVWWVDTLLSIYATVSRKTPSLTYPPLFLIKLRKRLEEYKIRKMIDMLNDYYSRCNRFPEFVWTQTVGAQLEVQTALS